jgi:2-dehydro-3-deoxygluconokinase
MPDLIAVGDVMVDILAPPLVRPVQHAPVEIRAGGSAVNAARAAVALGRTAAVVGCIGDDAVGRLLLELLEAEGLEGRLSVVAGERTGRVVAAGDAIVAERGANRAFAPAHVGTLDARAVLVSGYQLFRDDSGSGAEAALAADAVVAVDVGSKRLVESFGVGRARALLQRVDVVLGNADAVAAVGPLEGPVVVETLGAAGARVGGVTVAPERVLEEPLLGAGDAFAAGFLLAFAGGAAVGDCLSAGCRTVVRPQSAAP